MVDRQASLHIAPMLDVSYREFRYLMRLLSRRAVLWTEMVVDETLVHCPNPDWHLAFDELEHPIVCQIGGNNPEYAKIATKLVEKHGYDYIDLNCECPSTRVATTREFGAALMKNPNIAVRMIESISETASIPVSVKMRIGVDDNDNFDFLVEFIERLRPHCRRFIMHARKVYTQGLNPDQNRRIPPLNYHFVYQICERFPDCDFWINGGVNTLQEAKAVCFGSQTSKCQCTNVSNISTPSINCTAPPTCPPPNLRGVMLGRAARDNPCILWDVDRYFFGEPNPCHNRRQLLQSYCTYIEQLYPRRCCDNNPRITSLYSPPAVVHTREYCSVCESIYGTNVNAASNIMTSCPMSYSQQDVGGAAPKSTIKITTKVVDRAMKPIWGVFFNQPGSRSFRATCFRLSRDLTVRNCGPGYILRCALQSVPDQLLDQDFDVTPEITS